MAELKRCPECGGVATVAEKEMQSADVCTHKDKIKTSFAKIFVSGTPDRPYFNILYFDPADQDYHIGFSSYCLEYVFKWLSEEFEIEDAPAADVVPVVHGRWISWEEAGNFVPSPDRHECSVCHDAAQVLVNGFELLSDYCPNCGAKMDGGAE